MDTYNVLIIGSGPAGLFAAIWLERLGVDGIAVVDRKAYPAGGLLNDGKLNFDYRIGMDLNALQIDSETAAHWIEVIKPYFTRFPQCRQVTVVDENPKIEVLRGIAEEQGVQFIAPEQWHWGTDHGKSVVDYLRGHLKKTTFLLGTEVLSIVKCSDGRFDVICRAHRKKAVYSADVVLAAPGRSGAYWLRDMADKNGGSPSFWSDRCRHPG